MHMQPGFRCIGSRTIQSTVSASPEGQRTLCPSTPPHLVRWTIGIPIDDLLTAGGEEIALKADRDFNVQINGVLVKFHKDEPIRDWPQIVEFRKGRCPVTSLEIRIVATPNHRAGC
jgi:hypothetical protein